MPNKIFYLIFCFLSSLAEAKSNTSRTLVDYSGPQTKALNIVADPSAKENLDGLSWSKNYVGLKAEIDASDYDSLQIDILNSENEQVQLNLEIKDDLSTDYWSRVNNYLTIPPGLQKIRISLKLRVGDTSRPGRLLDLKNIRSLILARIENPEKSQILKIQKILLIKNPVFFPAGVRAFDFGSEETPVFPGFTGVTEKFNFNEKIGYGFKDGKFWHPYPGCNDSLQPDSLTRDSIFITHGEFRVDVPNGIYDVILNTGFSSGYWGEFPLFKKRKIFLQGREIVNKTLTRDQSARRYFAFAETEDRPDDDVFEKYYQDIFKDQHFKAKVEDGSLRLRFEGDNCAESPCFGMALTYLIIIPKKFSAQKNIFLKNILKERKKEFQQNFSFVPGSKKTKSTYSGKKLIVFDWNGMKEMTSDSFGPLRKSAEAIKLTALKGQTVHTSLGIWSPEKESIQIAFAPSKLSARAWPVSRRLTRLEPASHAYTIAEKYLSESDKIQLRGYESRHLWIEVQTLGLPPGVYKTTLKLKGRRQFFNIPVEIKILGFDLPAVDFPVGPFNSTVQEAWWFEGENEFREKILLSESLKIMKETGLTTATVNSRFQVDWSQNPLKILGLDQLSAKMDLFRQVGFKSLVLYNTIFKDQDLCLGNFSEKDLERWVFALKDEAKKRNWLPLQVIVCDEPIGDDSLAKASQRLKYLQKFNDEGLRFGAAFSFNDRFKEAKNLFEISNFPFLNEFNFDLLNQNQKSWVFYNGADRSSFGFGLFRLRQKTQLKGRLAWNWNQNAGNPYYALDGREDDINWCNSLLDGRLQCTIFLKRHIQEGLTDYRLMLALKNINIKNSELKIRALKIISEVEESASIQKKFLPGESEDKYVPEQNWKNQILALLEMISDAQYVKAKSK